MNKIEQIKAALQHASMSEHHRHCGSRTSGPGAGNGCSCHVQKAKDALDLMPEVVEAVGLLRQVERWMSGYGTTTQPEMRERIRAYLATNNLQDFEG